MALNFSEVVTGVFFLGDAVMVFPPPPPPYFADPVSPTVTRCLMSSGLPTSENPPPYHSIFSDG